MDKSTISSGPVRFVVKNNGTTTHALEVAGQGLDRKTPFLSPGETANLDMQLPPGQYEAWCPVNNHRANGMVTTFTAK